MDIAVTQVDSADESAVEQAYQVAAAALAADAPDFPPACRVSFVAGIRHPWPNRPSIHLLAQIGAAPAGYLKLTLPDLDNTTNALVDLSVHPAYRRSGVGRALYERAAAIAREKGRKRLMSDITAPLSDGGFQPGRAGGSAALPAPEKVAWTGAGAAFARAVGAEPALAEVRRRLDLSTVDRAVLDDLLADAWSHASGYSLVTWQDAVPDEYVDDVGYLDGRLVKDAPMGDLAWEPEQVDAARIRAGEEVKRLRQHRLYHAGLRHDATGRLVAWTTLDLEHCPPEHAWQQITIVEPRHRGHRLGTIAKIENLRFAGAHEPALRMIDTWNAAENDQMISINERIGFRAADFSVSFQHNL